VGERSGEAEIEERSLPPWPSVQKPHARKNWATPVGMTVLWRSIVICGTKFCTF